MAQITNACQLVAARASYAGLSWCGQFAFAIRLHHGRLNSILSLWSIIYYLNLVEHLNKLKPKKKQSSENRIRALKVPRNFLGMMRF